MEVTYPDIGHTTLMCYLGHYGLDGQTAVEVITGWIIRLTEWWVMVHTWPAGWRGFHIWGGGIKVWVIAVGHMESFRAQLGKTLSALLGIWC